MQQIKDIWEFASSMIRWGALLIGGICLLVTSAAIGQFPEDINVGEGVALYFLSAGFVLAYVLYWLALTSIGLCLLRWPMELLRFVPYRIPAHAPAYLPTNYKAMWAFPVWLIALLSVFFSLLLFRFQLVDLVNYGSLIVLQGFLGGLLLLIRRKLLFENSGVSMINVPGDKPNANSALRQGAYFLLAFWLFGPMLIGQNQGNFIDAAFRLAQLRKDHATVHIAAPWDKPFADAGLRRGTSFLGTTYTRFDDVTVRLRSMGSRVVIEVPVEKGKPQYIRIPRTSVEIE